MSRKTLPIRRQIERNVRNSYVQGIEVRNWAGLGSAWIKSIRDGLMSALGGKRTLGLCLREVGNGVVIISL